MTILLTARSWLTNGIMGRLCYKKAPLLLGLKWSFRYTTQSMSSHCHPVPHLYICVTSTYSPSSASRSSWVKGRQGNSWMGRRAGLVPDKLIGAGWVVRGEGRTTHCSQAPCCPHVHHIYQEVALCSGPRGENMGSPGWLPNLSMPVMCEAVHSGKVPHLLILQVAKENDVAGDSSQSQAPDKSRSCS